MRPYPIFSSTCSKAITKSQPLYFCISPVFCFQKTWPLPELWSNQWGWKRRQRARKEHASDRRREDRELLLPFLKVNSICSGEEGGWSAIASQAIVIKNGRPDKEGLGAGVKSGSTEGSHMQQLIYGPFRTPMCFKCDLAHTLTLTRFLAILFCHTLPFTHQTNIKCSAQNISGWPHVHMFIIPMFFISTTLTMQASWKRINVCQEHKSWFCRLCVLSINLEIGYWVIRKLYSPS